MYLNKNASRAFSLDLNKSKSKWKKEETRKASKTKSGFVTRIGRLKSPEVDTALCGSLVFNGGISIQ